MGTEMSGHISFAPDYIKWLLGKRDKAQVELIDFALDGIRDPQKNGFSPEKLKSLLTTFREATTTYECNLESEHRTNGTVHYNDHKLIGNILNDVDSWPEMPIGVAFAKVNESFCSTFRTIKIMTLVDPESGF